MSEETDAPRGSTVFALPEQSLFQLVQMQHHLRMMSQLTECGPELPMQSDAFAWWTNRLSKILEGVIDATYYSTELAMRATTKPAPAQS